MRLLNTQTLVIQEFHGDCHEDYAILSHTWGEEECTLQEMTSASVGNRKGFMKIRLCCQQAAKEGLKWAWVDSQVVILPFQERSPLILDVQVLH